MQKNLTVLKQNSLMVIPNTQELTSECLLNKPPPILAVLEVTSDISHMGKGV